MAALLVLVPSCELFLDINDDEPEPDADIPDASPPDAAIVLDAGQGGPLCARDPSYLDIGVANSRYRLVGELSFSAARVVCQDADADLVAIRSATEETAIAAVVAEAPSAPACAAPPCVWVGMSQQTSGSDPAADWAWVDGSADDGSLWATGQPDDADGVESGDQDCALMSAGELFDDSCGLEIVALCECNLLSQ
jgi:hypothetical protein